MKTKKTTPLSSSLDVALPTSWDEMTEAQLHLWARFGAVGTPLASKVKFLLAHIPTHRAQFSPSGLLYIEQGGAWHHLPADALAVAVEVLDFLDTPPLAPLSLTAIDGHTLHAPDLWTLSFEAYLTAENYYQNYLATTDTAALLALFHAVADVPPSYSLTPEGLYLLLLWYTTAKNAIARLFPFLYRPSHDLPETPDLVAMTNAQIRALTGGDVTKERTVLAIDAIRALTELNEKAREAATPL